MPDTIPDIEPKPLWQNIPLAVLLWLGITVVVFLISTQEVSLRDEERFVRDVRVAQEITEAENTVILNITAGTFEYGVRPLVPVPVEPGTFTDGTQSTVAAAIFDSIAEATEVIIEPQRIAMTYEGDMEGEQMLRRVERAVNNVVTNNRESMVASVVENDEISIVITTTEDSFEYGQFIPSLIPPDTQEQYASHAEGLAGSPLAQQIFETVVSVEALTIEPERLIVTYREGAVRTQVGNRIQEALNDFYPRAPLEPDLWLLTVTASPDKVIQITPLNTNIPLYLFTLAFAAIELGMLVYYRRRDDRLLRPLVRVVGVFLLFWSVFGHEPLWDYFLSQVFPTSRQLIHPSATVIQFTAQHLELVIVSSLITIPLGLFTGILVTRETFREVLPLVNNLVNSGQTVPTIAIVAIMAPIIGFGFWPAIIALIAYGLLPVVRNTIAGLEGVDASIIDSARGMGMTEVQILLRIELPIASGIIMAGIRTSMVVNVGTATLGAFVGSGGLGTPIASGLSMTIDAFILLGAIPAALLAILVDYILSRIEFVLTPRGLQIAA